MLNKVKFIFIIVTSVHFLPHAPARRCTCWRCASETAVATMESEETKTDDMVVLGTPYLEDCEPSSPRNNMYSFQTSLKEGKGFPLSSACLRCAACIAVAEKLNETLIKAHLTAYWLKKLEDNYVAELLRSLCINGFEMYGLYEIDGHRIISEAMSCSKYIKSELDGLWTKKLRELCHYYLDEYGEMNLYNTWLKNYPHPAHDMINKLCRSDRIFRDCMNIIDRELNTFTFDKKNIRIACP